MKIKENLNSLTVFIISSDKITYLKKKKKLLTEYEKILVKPIISVYPMARAFNEMHLKCQTKYFLQLDEDMDLKKGAINKLYREIINSNARIICVTGQLYEKGFGPGGSVKIWKTKIFNYFSFGDHRTVDRKFFRKIFYFKKKNLLEIFGYHKPRFNNFSKFSKVLGDISKWRYLKSNKIYLYQMLERVIIEKNFYEIMAVFVSLNVNKKFIIKSKNYKKDKQIFNLIKNLEKNFNLNFFDNNNSINFLSSFMDTYEEKQNIAVFNEYFINNLLKFKSKHSLDLNNSMINMINKI